MTQGRSKLTVSGFRGIWGSDLTEEVAFVYARAFAKMLNRQIKFGNEKKKILIGHDARKSARNIYPAISQAFKKENIETVYAGLLPTPSILLAIKEQNFDGGIIVTASHNPSEYNGIKFVMSGGRMTNESEVSEILNEYENLSLEEKIFNNTEAALPETDNQEFRELHINKILKNIDANLIREKKFKVALDPVNSAGAKITQELLSKLGCEIFIINENTEIDFAHAPEPLPENLAQIAEATIKNNCHIGFAQDPDADRLVVVAEDGKVVWEELTVVLAIENVLMRPENKNIPKKTVVNLSTTKTAEYITEKYDGRIHRSKVGEANVVEKMLENSAIIGGEGSGGVIYPPVGYFRDSLSAIGLILELLAKKNQPLSEIISSYPKYIMLKEKIQIATNATTLLAELKKHFENKGAINETDGLKVDFQDNSWIQIRASNTEPILRIFGESETQEKLEGLFNEVYLTLGLK